MDNQAQLLVRDEEGKYLLLETPSKKLLLPSARLKDEEDFQDAALRYITEVRVCTCTIGTGVAVCIEVNTPYCSGR